jgi:hypothetical protein
MKVPFQMVGAGATPLYPAGGVLVVGREPRRMKQASREPRRTTQTSSCTDPPPDQQQQFSQGDEQSQEACQEAQEDSMHCRKVRWVSTSTTHFL